MTVLGPDQLNNEPQPPLADSAAHLYWLADLGPDPSEIDIEAAASDLFQDPETRFDAMRLMLGLNLQNFEITTTPRLSQIASEPDPKRGFELLFKYKKEVADIGKSLDSLIDDSER